MVYKEIGEGRLPGVPTLRSCHEAINGGRTDKRAIELVAPLPAGPAPPPTN
jgi:hypothetical protein